MLVSTKHSVAQCVGKDSVWARIVSLRDNLKLSPTDKLKELKKIEDLIVSCGYSNDSVNSFLLQRIGMSYYRQSEYLKAIEYVNRSIKSVTEQSKRSGFNQKQNILNYFYLSVFYDSLKNVNHRMRAVDSCISIALRYISTSDIACLYSLYAKVQYLYDIGDYSNCVSYAKIYEKSAWDYTSQDPVRAKNFASNALGWQVMSLLELKDFGQAEELLNGKIEDYSKRGLHNYLGLIYGQLAQVQMDKGNFDKASSYLNEELKYEKAAGFIYNYKQTLNVLGFEIYLKHLKDPIKAIEIFRIALGQLNKDPNLQRSDSIESVSLLANIGTAFVHLKKIDSAFRYYALAFQMIRPGMNENQILNTSPEDIKQFKKIHYITYLLLDKGDAFQLKYKETGEKNFLEQSISIYKITDKLLDKIKLHSSDAESTLFWRSDSKRLYEQAINACYLGSEPEAAFYFFEKSRAVLLSDELSIQRLVGEDDIIKLSQVKKKILQLQNEVGVRKSEIRSEARSQTSLKGLEDEIFKQKQQLELLEQNIRNNNPLYYQSFIDTNLLTIEVVRNRLLNDHDALIEYFSGDSAVYSIMITKNNSTISRIDKKAFDNITSEFTARISNAEFLNKEYRKFVEISNGLYKLLFNNSPPPQGRIIISPAGKYFPFEALAVNLDKAPSYFIEDHAISYTYSARYLLNNFRRNNSVQPRNFIGIAPVSFSPMMRLSPLVGSDRSLDRVQSRFWQGDNLKQDQASRANFTQRFFRYKVIQLYTHGSETGFNKQPTLFFADSALLLSDLIYENKPLTELIVISACESGSGNLYQGEGVFSFNRGFAALGIPSSISNLWQVENESTYKLTELFYKYLTDGKPIDLALQSAKKEFIENAKGEYRLPYYWSAAILTGKSNAIDLERPEVWRYAVLAIGVLTLVFGLMRWRKSGKTT